MKKIYIRNTIGWHVTNTEFSSVFQDAIKKEKEEKGKDGYPEVDIHINSPGGSVYMGWDIFNEIRHAVSEGVVVKTYNNGLAASMASIILLAADPEHRYVSENSLGMIHNPSGIAFGDEEDMKKEQELLGKIGDLMSSYYAKVTDTEKEYMKALMSATTWFKPDEMVSEGFIPKGNIVDGGKPIEQVDVVGMDKSAFAKMPNNFEKILCFSEKLPTSKDGKFREDLTTIHNSKIRERTWKNYMKS
jgi:ATP-dependent protease ClpP protease subunit